MEKVLRALRASATLVLLHKEPFASSATSPLAAEPSTGALRPEPSWVRFRALASFLSWLSFRESARDQSEPEQKKRHSEGVACSQSMSRRITTCNTLRVGNVG